MEYLYLGLLVVAMIFFGGMFKHLPLLGTRLLANLSMGGTMPSNTFAWIAAALALVVAWLYMGYVWVILLGLIVGGGFLLWRNKLAQLGKCLLAAGVIIAIATWLFGAENVEKVLPQVARKAVAELGWGFLPPPPLTPAELAEEAERVRQAAALARIREVEAAKAAEAIRIATEREFEESRTLAQVSPCLRRYTDQKNCTTVVFGYHTFYQRRAEDGHCIVSDPAGAMIRTDLGGGQYRFVGPPGLAAQFFDLPIGASIGNFTCRE